MAGRGPAPAQRRARDRDTPDRAELAADGQLRGPKLPSRYRVQGDDGPEDIAFLAATKRWYETWRRSAMARSFVDTDWQRLLMLAPLVDRFHRGEARLMQEIRLNEERLGATVLDRRRLGVEVADQDPTPTPGPESAESTDELAERRRRVESLATGG